MAALAFVVCFAFVSCNKNNPDNTDVPDTDLPENDITEPVLPDDAVEDTDGSKEETQKEQELPVEVQPEKMTVTLYFPDNDALYLHAEEREIVVEKTSDNSAVDVLSAVLEELFKGPSAEGLGPSVIGEDLVNSVELSEDGTCTIDFKSDFAFLNAGGTARESFMFGSIVNSLCKIEGVERVKFNIDGNKAAEFGGHFTLEEPVSPQWDLVKE